VLVVGGFGAGALGLTSATLAQRAGARTTIYAAERFPAVRSARAAGLWTPDSRIAKAAEAGPQFGALWEQMARTSFKAYRAYLGLPGDPVQWIDRYLLFDDPVAERLRRGHPPDLGFGRYEHRIADLTPRARALPPASHPFPVPRVARTSQMMFNIADYAHQLTSDFLQAGGRMETMVFHEPSELAGLKEKVVIDCTGYGARSLWRDETVVPVRGQIAWLIPQPEVVYGLSYHDVSLLPRRDGIVVQRTGPGEAMGWNDANETPDRQESLDAIAEIAGLYARMGGA
jgi:glycine/D-amino acid oxidase-like deaminating enzyme